MGNEAAFYKITLRQHAQMPGYSLPRGVKVFGNGIRGHGLQCNHPVSQIFFSGAGACFN